MGRWFYGALSGVWLKHQEIRAHAIIFVIMNAITSREQRMRSLLWLQLCFLDFSRSRQWKRFRLTYAGKFSFLHDLFKFDTVTNIWEEITSLMSGPRIPGLCSFSMISNSDGNIYLFGGTGGMHNSARELMCVIKLHHLKCTLEMQPWFWSYILPIIFAF